MSENKKPENLLAEIWYSPKRVHASYYKDGKFTHADENASIVGDLPADALRDIVLDIVGSLLNIRKCGIVVEAPRSSDSDTVIQVYGLPDRIKSHRLFGGSDYFSIDGWLRKALREADAYSVHCASAAACAPLSSAKFAEDASTKRERAEAWEEPTLIRFPSFFSTERGAASLLHAVAKGKRVHAPSSSDGDTAPDPTDHIPALRGLFALARGDYATVSAEDLTAAVDAGYVHPDVLACVADEIAE